MEKRDTVSCESSNIVYLVECQKDNCKGKYIGESHRILKDIIQEHKGNVNKQVHSLCVDSRPGDRLWTDKGPP